MADYYDGRLYFYGGSKKDRLYIGGKPGAEKTVATGLGGAFIDIEEGTGLQIKKVLKFVTHNGGTIITALTYHPNTSKGARYNIVETNITLTNESATKGFSAEKVDNVVGCASYYGAGTFLDGLYAINRYGLAITTKTMENQNRLMVQWCSDQVKPLFTDLLGEQITESVLVCINEVIYLILRQSTLEGLESVVLVYDIHLKA